MTDQNDASEGGSLRWQWVGADPDDMSEDARFRRQVAALTREVMLAHGAASDAAPPTSRTRAVRDAAPDPHGTDPALHAPDHTPGTGGPPERLRAPDDSDIHSSTPYLLALAGRALLARVERAGSPTGVATTDLVLMTVARSRGGATMTQLVNALGLQPSTVSMAARRLVDRGWVDRRPSSRDRRRVILVATETGREAAERAAATWRHADDRLLDGLTLTERDELCRLLRRAVSALAARRPSR